MRSVLSFFYLTLALNLTLAFGVSKKELLQAEITYKDIRQTLGSVPSFLKSYPEGAIAGAWMDMKNLQLNSQTALSGKYKELIGLAVSAQIPCRFCTYFHTQAAKLNGASEQEIKEAIAVAGITRRWSTYMHGSESDLNQFKIEVNSMMEFVQKNLNKQAMEERRVQPAKEISTASEAFEEMKAYYGLVPTFIKNYPEMSIAGAWLDFKAVVLNPETALPGKIKDLIGLAVSSQIPCPHSIYYSTESAMVQGATSKEINEAIAMSGATRNWSTILNGHYTDEKNFEKEADKVMKHLKSKMPKEVTLNNF